MHTRLALSVRWVASALFAYVALAAQADHNARAIGMTNTRMMPAISQSRPRLANPASIDAITRNRTGGLDALGVSFMRFGRPTLAAPGELTSIPRTPFMLSAPAGCVNRSTDGGYVWTAVGTQNGTSDRQRPAGLRVGSGAAGRSTVVRIASGPRSTPAPSDAPWDGATARDGRRGVLVPVGGDAAFKGRWGWGKRRQNRFLRGAVVSGEYRSSATPAGVSRRLRR